MKEIIRDSLREAQSMLDTFINDDANIEIIYRAASICAEALRTGHKILSCGNGGSLCDATHFAEELTGRYRNNRQPFPALAINDAAYMTCVGNDFSFNEIFSRYVEAVGQQGDILLAISTSGRSKNMIDAAEQAHKSEMIVIALTSQGKNELTKNADVAICAPSAAHSDRIQEIHIKVIHILIQVIEELLKVGQS
ncbi:SIS domain-containing protein [Parabacteroides sp. AM08-6]|uniref:SIS domain-containing protein n=1 Tax=Parabacteroides sp. AM08-6 TaxID=2292053 RepID=UPI000EFF2157|nr:SIS domain-containing protein [Parabacteroides sp. AM08-6]RHJ81013.1 SIS domain-containing protein [Parabacteroides sp. AM08-6]